MRRAWCAALAVALQLQRAAGDDDIVFREHVVSTTFPSPYLVVGYDLDSDGDLDLIAGSDGGGLVGWFENDGSQTFDFKTIVETVSDVRTGATVDLDGDGDADLLIGLKDEGLIVWYENDGSQSFFEVVVDDETAETRSIFAVDLDLDGDVDVLVTSFTEDELAWLENDGAQNFARNLIATDRDGPRFVVAIDLDEDGDIDPVLASDGDGYVTMSLRRCRHDAPHKDERRRERFLVTTSGDLEQERPRMEGRQKLRQKGTRTTARRASRRARSPTTRRTSRPSRSPT